MKTTTGSGNGMRKRKDLSTPVVTTRVAKYLLEYIRVLAAALRITGSERG